MIDSGNSELQLRVDGLLSDVMNLTERVYNSGEDLAEELQTRIDNDERIGKLGLVVEWFDEGATGYLRLTSGSYGASSKVEMMAASANTALSILGLGSGTSVIGLDVEGTINGESATGRGQILIGDEDNGTTDGLKLKVSMTEDDLASGSEGTVSIIKGLASIVESTLVNITKAAEGTIARRTTAINNQIGDLNEQIERYDERLARRREDLYMEFLMMEEALSEYQSINEYLTSQIANLSSNWVLGSRKNNQ
jgi:flagellar hook-associated protein 2